MLVKAVILVGGPEKGKHHLITSSQDQSHLDWFIKNQKSKPRIKAVHL
jgi:hypothetical protein